MNRTDNRSAFFAHAAMTAAAQSRYFKPSYSGFVMPKAAPKAPSLFARLLSLI